MKKIFKRLPAALFIAFTLYLAPCALHLVPSTLYLAHAQTPEAFHLSVSPPVAYLQVKPGETLRHTITVSHQGSVPLKITPQLINFDPAESGQGIVLDPETTFPHLSAESKKSVSESFTLQPGEKRRVLVEAQPPAGSLDREYHLTLLFTGQPETEAALSAGAQVSGTIGSNIVLMVSNTTLNRGDINIKEIKSATVLDSLQALRFSLMAENSGSRATPASGSAKITNWRGDQVAEFQIFPDMVLAQSQRLLRPASPREATVSGTISTEPPASTDFSYDPLFLLGPYKIEVTLLSAQGSPETVVMNIFALPLSLIVLLVVSVALYAGFTVLRTKLPLGSLFKTY